jgi:hypothetical protein
MEDVEVRVSAEKAAWLAELIRTAMPARARHGKGGPSLGEVRAGYPWGGPHGFDALLRAQSWYRVRAAGLLLV